jgi:hypothetical protein
MEIIEVSVMQARALKGSSMAISLKPMRQP